jgi:hypothetical protein
VLNKATKNAYRTRFLLQSGAAASNKNTNKKSSQPPTSSKLIQRMGGMAMFDFVFITLSERIEKDPAFEPVYGNLTLKALIQLQKELLLFAFSDAQDAFSLHDDASHNNNILYRHCELGLMTDPSYFHIFLLEHLRALDDCMIEQEGKKKEGVLLKCGSCIAKLRPLLEETHKQTMTMTMTKIAVQAKHAKKQEQPSKRPFLFRRRRH